MALFASFEYPPAPPSSPVSSSSFDFIQQQSHSHLSFLTSSFPHADTPPNSDTDTSTMSSSLTPLERSRQARGKDINDKPKATTTGKGKKKGDATDKTMDGKEAKTSNELFEEQERMHTAATILESNELLIFHAHANNESIPQTRLRFEKMLIGIEDSSDEWEEELEEDNEVGIAGGQRAPKGPEKGEGSKKRAAR